MKPHLASFVVVTATSNPERAESCITSWRKHSTFSWPLIVVKNGSIPTDERLWDQAPWAPGTAIVTNDFLGVVPAFARGVEDALANLDAQIIVCLHDDLEILDDNWDGRVLDHFLSHPDCVLAGFGGGTALGDGDIYQTPYNPMQLARQDFTSNMVDAEAHGRRSEVPERVACLDGFSQIMRRGFAGHNRLSTVNIYQQMADLGIVHHAYDALLGIYAAESMSTTWMLPIFCKHHGGQTAVGDQNYHVWARQQHPRGDQGFWEQAHKIVYKAGRGVLPLRCREGY